MTKVINLDTARRERAELRALVVRALEGRAQNLDRAALLLKTVQRLRREQEHGRRDGRDACREDGAT